MYFQLLLLLLIILIILIYSRSCSNFEASKYNIIIIVPCRNRQKYWKIFKEEMDKYLANQKLKPLYVLCANNGGKFNRGNSINLALAFLKQHFPKNTTVVTQDVDMIPRHGVKYNDKNTPIMTWFINAGGLKGSLEDFIKINGYSNDYHGWGEEDSDIYDRMGAMGVKYGYWPPTANDAGILDLELKVSEKGEKAHSHWYYQKAKKHPRQYSQNNKKYGIKVDKYKQDWHSTNGFNKNKDIRKAINKKPEDLKKKHYLENGLSSIDLDRATIEYIGNDVVEIRCC
jgi:hypothetical protein